MWEGRLFGWPLALAIGAHAAGLALTAQNAPRIAKGAAEGVRSVKVRIVAPQAQPAANPDAAIPAAVQAAPAAPAAPAAGAEVPAAAPVGLPTGRDTAGDLAGYIPRNQLTRAPQPVTTVEVPFPDGLKGTVDLKVPVSLYIDETGQVQRVRIDAEVPQPFADSIHRTFARARFKPGEVGDVAVRSLLRIEVVFETESAPPPSAGLRPPGS